MTTKIIFYELSDGSMPVADYLSTLDVKIRAKAALLPEAEELLFQYHHAIMAIQLKGRQVKTHL